MLNVNMFRKFIFDEGLLFKGQPVLLAVSGGVDSVVLAHLFYECGEFPFGIAYFNHHLRESSYKDDVFIRRLAFKYRVPFFIGGTLVEEFACKHKMSIEEAGRHLRYQWLDWVRRRHGYHYVATAHHRDDVTETVLMNLIRGSGWRGMKGIVPKRDFIIRPLLFASKSEIEKYALEKGLSWMEDETNKDLRFRRNFIRHRVMPILRELNPEVDVAIYNHARIMRDLEWIAEISIQRIKNKVVKRKDGEAWIPFRKVLSYPAYRTIFYEILKEFGFNVNQVDQLIDLVRGNEIKVGATLETDKFKLVIDRTHLIIIEKTEEEEPSIVPVPEIPTIIELPEGKYVFELLSAKDVKITADKNIAYLDYDKLEDPIILRFWRDGDYFYPFGLRKKKKIKKFLTDEKVPTHLKKKVRVLQSGDYIVWVIPYRIDDRFKVTERTKRVLKVSFKPS